MGRPVTTPGLERASALLACPVCAGGLSADSGSLRCEKGHSFDISRQGYVNLLMSKPPDDYGKAMLSARRELALAGLWDGALDSAAELAGRFCADGPVLDAGCGEGSHLSGFVGRLKAPPVSAGLDISRDAVSLAASAYRDICWAVGDLSRAPFLAGSFGLVLNILSPARYREFARLLAPAGVLVKAVPGRDYLRELREAFFEDSRREYSPGKAAARFEESFELIGSIDVNYKLRIGRPLLPALTEMTPLGWNADPQRKRALSETDGMEVTVDMRLLAGRARGGH